jgi:pimeloyl-ACP methyl ester carboxylesterase
MTELPLPALDGVEHRFVTLPGLTMHVAEAGHGEPLLLLHGFPQHWWGWSKVLPALAQHYRVICPDLRGAGWTDAPRTGYASEQLVADVIALLEAMQIDRARVMGHDWGALVGFLLCVQHPERVERFVALAVPNPFVRIQPRLLPALPRLWFQYAIATPVLGPALLRRGSQPLARHLLENYTADPTAFSASDVELFIAPFREPARARAGSALYRNFIVPIFGRVLAGRYRRMRLRTPTLIMFGSDDPNMSAEILDGHQRHADDLTVQAVTGASHFLVDERPDEVVERALVFLDAGG